MVDLRTPDEVDAAREIEVAAWLSSKVTVESERLQSLGQRCLVLPVRNMGLVCARRDTDNDDTGGGESSARTEGGNRAVRRAAAKKHKKSKEGRQRGQRTITNRVEFSTAFDFDKVTKLYVSPPLPCDLKPGFRFSSVALLTAQEREGGMAMLFGYLFDGSSQFRDNDLSRWEFVNKLGASSLHEVEGFEAVTEEEEDGGESAIAETEEEDKEGQDEEEG